jgi:hypothetical protein
MKHFLLALALVASNAVAVPLYVYTDEWGAAFLTDEPCSQKDVVANVNAAEVMRASHFYVQYTAEGKKNVGTDRLEGCYLIEDQVVFFINERGQSGVMPLNVFSKLKVEFI